MTYETFLSIIERTKRVKISDAMSIIEELYRQAISSEDAIEEYSKIYDLFDLLLQQPMFIGDADDYHNLAVVCAKQGDFDVACRFLDIGLNRYPYCIDLLADYLNYGMQCDRKESCNEAYEKLILKKDDWNWRAYRFAIDYLINLTSIDCDSRDDKILSLITDFQNKLPDDEDYIFRVVIPEEKVVEVKDGVTKEKVKKMFPGYVLINMVMNDDTWYVVRNTRGVTGFVGPGSDPVPLSEAEMRNLGIVANSNSEVEIDIEIGDLVEVTSGAWEGRVSTVTAINMNKQTVTIEVDMFGRETSVEIGSTGIATLYPATVVKFAEPSTIKVYLIKEVKNGFANLVEVASDQPLAGFQGYIIKGAEGTYALSVQRDAAELDDANMLKGSIAATTINSDDNTNRYFLASDAEGNISFKKIASETESAARKAWLEIPASKESGQYLSIAFPNGGTTGISSASVKTESNKDGVCYDLNGVAKKSPAKGINIRNGKKFVIK